MNYKQWHFCLGRKPNCGTESESKLSATEPTGTFQHRRHRLLGNAYLRSELHEAFCINMQPMARDRISGTMSTCELKTGLFACVHLHLASPNHKDEGVEMGLELSGNSLSENCNNTIPSLSARDVYCISGINNGISVANNAIVHEKRHS